MAFTPEEEIEFLKQLCKEAQKQVECTIVLVARHKELFDVLTVYLENDNEERYEVAELRYLHDDNRGHLIEICWYPAGSSMFQQTSMFYACPWLLAAILKAS